MALSGPIELVLRLGIAPRIGAIVLVEQYFEWARDLCDSYAVMDRGQVVLAGPRAGMVEADVLRWMSV